MRREIPTANERTNKRVRRFALAQGRNQSDSALERVVFIRRVKYRFERVSS